MVRPRRDLQVGLASLVLLVVQLGGCKRQPTKEFPNELPGYRFVDTAKWRDLLSTETEASDVLSLMGEPIKDLTISSTKRLDHEDYKVRHLRYKHDEAWDVSFLVTLRDRHNRKTNSLYAVRLYPRKIIDFSEIEFPDELSQREVTGAASSSTLYSDRQGLTYRVHRETFQEEERPPGALVSIEYRLTSR